MKIENTHGSPLDYVQAGKQLRCPRGANYTPAELMQRGVDYLEFMRDRHWNKVEVLKGGEMAGTFYDVPTSCPLDIKSFFLFAGFGARRWQKYRENEAYEDVCDWIEDCIELQNYEGAAVGVFNANLVARRHKIADKHDTTVSAAPEQITGMVITID